MLKCALLWWDFLREHYEHGIALASEHCELEPIEAPDSKRINLSKTSPKLVQFVPFITY